MSSVRDIRDIRVLRCKIVRELNWIKENTDKLRRFQKIRILIFREIGTANTAELRN